MKYMLAKIQAKRGNLQECLVCLKKAKDDGYRNLANVYKDEEAASSGRIHAWRRSLRPQQRSSGIKRTDWCRLQKRRTRSGTAIKAAPRLRVRPFSSMRFISHPAWRMHTLRAPEQTASSPDPLHTRLASRKSAGPPCDRKSAGSALCCTWWRSPLYAVLVWGQGLAPSRSSRC